MSHTPWKSVRVGETGFAGGYDVYAVQDCNGREIACGLTKEQAAVIASAPDLLETLIRLTSIVEFMRTMGAYRGGSLAGMGELDRAEQEARTAINAARGK